MFSNAYVLIIYIHNDNKQTLFYITSNIPFDSIFNSKITMRVRKVLTQSTQPEKQSLNQSNSTLISINTVVPNLNPLKKGKLRPTYPAASTVSTNATNPCTDIFPLPSPAELQLFKACKIGDLDLVYWLLWDHVNVNCRLSILGSS